LPDLESAVSLKSLRPERLQYCPKLPEFRFHSG
jgi:hypothetical protein